MNSIFGSDDHITVYNHKINRPKPQYVQVRCKFNNCPFSFWLTHDLEAEESPVKLKINRYINWNHSFTAH